MGLTPAHKVPPGGDVSFATVAAMDGLPATELAWTRMAGGESCIERQELAARVEAIVGRRTFLPAGTQGGDSTLVAGQVGPDAEGRGWLAVIEARRAGATPLRRNLGLISSDCRQLDEAIVLVVALMVDSGDTGAPTPVLRIPQAPQPVRVAVAVDAGVTFGMLPGVATGFGLAADVTVPPIWPIAVWTNVWPISQALDERAGGRLQAWTLGAGLCPVAIARPSWEFFGCAGATGGAIDSSGVGINRPKDEAREYVQGELRAGFRVRLAGPLFLGLQPGAAVPFTRYAYQYALADGSVHEVFRTAPVVALGHATLEVRVP
jgi:hypothetical protein